MVAQLKYRIALVLGALLFSQGAQAQFAWQTMIQPFDENNSTYGFEALSCYGNYCVVAGLMNAQNSSQTNMTEKNAFFLTADGGRTWTMSETKARDYISVHTNRIRAAQQIDSLNLIAVGDTLIVRSSDGGKTWTEMPCPMKDSYVKVHFSSTTTGVILSFYGRVFTTFDGGAHWSNGFSPMRNWSYDCHSDGGQRFRVFTYPKGVVYHTSDNWLHYDSTLPILYKDDDTSRGADPYCFFQGWSVNRDTIYGYGTRDVPTDTTTLRRGLLCRSFDNGQHWEIVHAADSFVYAVGCTSQLDRDTILVGGVAYSKVLRSNDRGKTWYFDTVNCTFDRPKFHLGWTSGLSLLPDGSALGLFSSDQDPVRGGGYFVARGTLCRAVVPLDNSQPGTLLFPNPARNSITALKAFETNITSVIDALGRPHTVPNDERTFDISQLPPGVYYVSDGKQRAKFVKE